MKMFLDDLRDPPDAEWIVARSVAAAIQHIERHGVPNVVSFDHDLGDAPSGLDLVKWMIEQHLNETHRFPDDFTFMVHSANPPGRANIIGLLGQFLAVIRNT